MSLSDRINRLSESATIAMSRKSRELRAQGIDVINLSLGEPDFNTPDFIKEAANKAIAQNYSKYTPVPGHESLRKVISEKFQKDNNLNYAVSQISVSTGAKQCIANVVLSLINPGDEVILPAPFWVTYEEIVKLAHGVPVIIPTSIENDFKITADELSTAVTDKTKLMIFSSPCNPSGSIYSKQELDSLANVISQKDDFYVICDEIYEYINFEGTHTSLAACEGMYDRVVTVNGVSKAYAMTGWRVGYIGAPQWITDACNKMQGQFTSGTCSVAQKAAEAAISTRAERIGEMKDAFFKRRTLMMEELGRISGIKINKPQGAFYIFPDVFAYFGKSFGERKIKNATDLSMYLLEEAHVAVVTGTAFGSPNNIRISYVASDGELREAISRIASALQKLR